MISPQSVALPSEGVELVVDAEGVELLVVFPAFPVFAVFLVFPVCPQSCAPGEEHVMSPNQVGTDAGSPPAICIICSAIWVP